MKPISHFIIRFLTLIILGFLAVLLAYQYFVPGFHVDRGISGVNMKNATWIAHEWVGEAHSREEIHSLLSTLISNQISLVFVHSGPIDSDGSIPASRYRHAESFLETAKTLAPEMEFHAWIGQIREKLPLEDPYVRENIVSTAASLIEDTSFDGIHLNIEPMHKDPELVSLMKEIEMTFDEMVEWGDMKNRKMSVAITPIVPEFSQKILKKISRGSAFLGYELDGKYNDIEYVKELAKYVDYMVLMGYDTGFQDIETYQWFLEQELIFLLKAAPGKAILALPTYEDERKNFNHEVENIKNGLIGVRNGLSNIRVKADNLVGIALYSRWTTSNEEWGIWQDMWLKNNKND